MNFWLRDPEKVSEGAFVLETAYFASEVVVGLAYE